MRHIRKLHRGIHILVLAYRDPRVPLPAKIVVMCVAAYALSPIDLIPDFIPILGQLDDLVLVPLGIALATRMIPAEVLRECAQRVDADRSSRPAGFRASRIAAGVILALWALVSCVATVAIFRVIFN